MTKFHPDAKEGNWMNVIVPLLSALLSHLGQKTRFRHVHNSQREISHTFLFLVQDSNPDINAVQEFYPKNNDKN